MHASVLVIQHQSLLERSLVPWVTMTPHDAEPLMESMYEDNGNDEEEEEAHQYGIHR